MLCVGTSTQGGPKTTQLSLHSTSGLTTIITFRVAQRPPLTHKHSTNSLAVGHTITHDNPNAILITNEHGAHTLVPSTTSGSKSQRWHCKPAHTPIIFTLLGATIPTMMRLGYGTPYEAVAKASKGYDSADCLPTPNRGKARRDMQMLKGPGIEM
ncbi:hypothetical protein AMTR_s00047p00063200 [Amborella trichopoda]|uniref:Uncharacterized protein n=1 Tax=Amborella trichopoda TaxID=13333 RepID=U5CWL1_AMBTC|nr:hypothetical protein AMTR_s00047p00063200 [Amborella trichopoda]